MKKHIVIIGNGVSGISAARNIRKLSDHRITVISGESEYFFSRTALMYVFMGHMKLEHTEPYERWFYKKNRIELVRGWVKKIHSDEKKIDILEGASIAYDELIVATGSRPRFSGWPGQNLDGVQGLYSLQGLETLESSCARLKDNQRAVIVGGGLIGIELAEMLASRNIPVTFLVRESTFWASVLPSEEGNMIDNHIREHHIDLRLATELKEILPDPEHPNHVGAIITSSGEKIECGIVGLSIGVQPNIEFLMNSGISIDRGVMVDEYLRTNVDHIYAIGDCAQLSNPDQGRRSIEAVWYTGKMMGEVVAKTIVGTQTAYHPGVWYNSAKFFDIEYQTYGHVSAIKLDGEEQLYWKHPTENKSLRLCYRCSDRRFLGVNTFGIRMKHEVYDRWINQEKDISYVIDHLADAYFDPEFYRNDMCVISNHFSQEVSL